MLPSKSQEATGTELTAELLKRFGAVRIRVQGSSMLPSMRPGDDIELQSSSSSEIKIGEIAAYRRDDRLFVHRVVGTNPLVARGDALSQEDAPVSEIELLGVVTGVFRKGEKVDHRTTFMQRAIAVLFRRSRFCAALFVKFASL